MDIRCWLFSINQGTPCDLTNIRNLQVDSISLWTLPELSKYRKMISQVKAEGIYSFGGLSGSQKHSYAETHVNNDIRFMEVGPGRKQWKVLEIEGKPPQPRYFHSMEHFEDSNMLVVFGGRAESTVKATNFCLNDVWLLDLYFLSWIELN